jgi:hypothetical protein
MMNYSGTYYCGFFKRKRLSLVEQPLFNIDNKKIPLLLVCPEFRVHVNIGVFLSISSFSYQDLQSYL